MYKIYKFINLHNDMSDPYPRDTRAECLDSTNLTVAF